jgi:hypothetical protein
MGSCQESPRNGRGLRHRRKAKARQEAALAAEKASVTETFSRAEAFTCQLQAELAEAARCHRLMAAIIVELSAMTGGTGCP